MIRLGTLLTFKSDISNEEAVEALEKIKGVLDLPSTSYEKGGKVKPFEMEDAVNEFDDEWGGPVWYIP